MPFAYDPRRHQPIQRYYLRLDPPDLSDQTDDWSRVSRELAQFGVEQPQASLALLREMAHILRAIPATRLAGAVLNRKRLRISGMKRLSRGR